MIGKPIYNKDTQPIDMRENIVINVALLSPETRHKLVVLLLEDQKRYVGNIPEEFQNEVGQKLAEQMRKIRENPWMIDAGIGEGKESI